MDEGVEKEVHEIESSKIEVTDNRPNPDALQITEFVQKLKEEKIEEKLLQFEGFCGKYSKKKVLDGLAVGLVEGRVGNGQVVDGVLTVNLPTNQEINSVTEETKPLLDILSKLGIIYSDLVLTLASSTVLHESEHVIIDSRPGSALEKDFVDCTGIRADPQGHTLALLDEGIVYAFQIEKDSEGELFRKLGEISPDSNDNFIVASRKQLGAALRSKVREYINEGKQIDEAFLRFAGEEMTKMNVDRYVNESERESMERRSQAR